MMVTDEHHVKQVKYVLKGTCSTSCTAIATEVGISPASVYSILTNSLGKRKICAKWIPHVLNDDQRAMCVLLANTHLQHWRNEGNAFLNRILTVDKLWMH
jgi:uracil DNA glycosylase